MPALFTPPLSNQRYSYVENLLKQNPQLTSITDVGCGSGRMVRWLKSVATLASANFIDSEYPLEDCEEQDRYLRPPLLEAIFGRQGIDQELAIRVFTGDIVIPDERLHADVFSLVEMIEHVSLDKVQTISRAVFGFYQPKLVVVTTPNTEVNPVLTQLSEGHSSVPFKPLDPANKFRHSDHKFEWTRAEFEQWAQHICSTYPHYTYRLDGVGQLAGAEALGPATQIAVFARTSAQPDVQLSNLACSDLRLERMLVSAPERETVAEHARNHVTLVGDFSVPRNKWPKHELHKYPSWDLVDANGVDHYKPSPGDPFYEEFQRARERQSEDSYNEYNDHDYDDECIDLRDSDEEEIVAGQDWLSCDEWPMKSEDDDEEEKKQQQHQHHQSMDSENLRPLMPPAEEW